MTMTFKELAELAESKACQPVTVHGVRFYNYYAVLPDLKDGETPTRIPLSKAEYNALRVRDLSEGRGYGG